VDSTEDTTKSEEQLTL